VVRSEEVAAEIASFPTWDYEFDLAGHRTPIAPEVSRRQRERERYIFDPIRRILGESLKGKRVLDLGCNAGYWSLRALALGCDFVLGIDGRQMHVDQANFVFEVKGIDPSRYEFAVEDVFAADLTAAGPFDLVLCLGLLYQVSDPTILIEKISQVNTELLVIDTNLSLMPGRFLALRREQAGSPLTAPREQQVLCPTRQAVISLAESSGYSVATLTPSFRSYEASYDYEEGRRRAFICARDPRALDLIADQTEAVTAPRVALTAARAAFQSGLRRLTRSTRPGT